MANSLIFSLNLNAIGGNPVPHLIEFLKMFSHLVLKLSHFGQCCLPKNETLVNELSQGKTSEL